MPKIHGNFPDWMTESDRELLYQQRVDYPRNWMCNSTFQNLRVELGYDHASNEEFLCQCGKHSIKGYNNLNKNNLPKRLCRSCLIKELYKKNLIKQIPDCCISFYFLIYNSNQNEDFSDN